MRTVTKTMRQIYRLYNIYLYFTSSNVIMCEYQLVMFTWYKYVAYIPLKTILDVIALLLILTLNISNYR